MADQRGAALMIMLLLLVLGAAVLFSRNLTTQLPSVTRAKSNAVLLAEAKAALLDYAATWDATHPGELGFLPCPVLNATGSTAEGAASDQAQGQEERSREVRREVLLEKTDDLASLRQLARLDMGSGNRARRDAMRELLWKLARQESPTRLTAVGLLGRDNQLSTPQAEELRRQSGPV